MSDDIKKGLLGIVVDETEVSKVMPEINSLTYRGYAAQDLCEYCRFEEVAYLILNKDLPNTIQLRQFEKEERNHRELTKNLYEIRADRFIEKTKEQDIKKPKEKVSANIVNKHQMKKIRKRTQKLKQSLSNCISSINYLCRFNQLSNIDKNNSVKVIKTILSKL